MPSDELVAEIDQAVEEMVSEGTNEDKEEQVALAEAGKRALDAEAESDEAKAAAEVASVDAAADAKIAEGEESAQKLIDESGAAAEAAGQEAAKAAVSDSTLARAVNVGIPVADARELSPGLLERIIATREAELAEVDTEVQKSPEETVDPFANLPKLDPEVHDPEVIKAFESLTGIIKGQQEEMRGLQDQQSQSAQAAQEANDAALAAGVRDVEQFFNKQVEGLGDDFSEALGTGDNSSLDRGSPQFAKRDAIAGQMSVLLSGYAAQGLQAPSREDVFDTAARIVLKEEFQGVHEKKLAGGLGKQAGQIIQRVGSVQAATKLSPEEEAAAEVDAFLAKKA